MSEEQIKDPEESVKSNDAGDSIGQQQAEPTPSQETPNEGLPINEQEKTIEVSSKDNLIINVDGAKEHGLERPVKLTNESSQKDKLVIYKGLAIKLKKDLLKTREELQKLRGEFNLQVSSLSEKVDSLEKTIESERVVSTYTNSTLEATVKNLRNQVDLAERDLQAIQKDYDNYKAKATKLLQQQTVSVQSSLDKKPDEERLKQLRSLNELQKEQINSLQMQMKIMTAQKEVLEKEIKTLSDKMEATNLQYESLQKDHEKVISENEVLKSNIEQYRAKTRGKQRAEEKRVDERKTTACKIEQSVPESCVSAIPDVQQLEADDEETLQDDEHTNSSSSFDSSSHGYVHIKPTAFEIISRSSVFEDAQNQIDNLTKAYLDSESTNSLLTEQVKVLKEEIRRIQRGNDRMDLANNLEYLKNVVFKFLSLDSTQVEQRQRLIPVFSTVLKLSPDEVGKLNAITSPDKSSTTSSFFKL